MVFKNQVDGAIGLGFGSGSVQYPYFTTPLQGIQNRASIENITVDWNLQSVPKNYYYNYSLPAFNNEGLNMVVDPWENTATSSDVNLVFTMGNGGEVVDRTNMKLDLDGDKTIAHAVKNHNNNVIIVNAVGQIDMSKWINHKNVSAVIFAPPLGQDTGRALKMLFLAIIIHQVNYHLQLPRMLKIIVLIQLKVLI